MKVLLDESVPKALGYELQGHFVRTAQYAGFAGLSNGALLDAMRLAGYEALVTFDQNLPYQQNTQLPVKVVVLVANDNRVVTAKAFVAPLLRWLDAPPDEQVTRLSII